MKMTKNRWVILTVAILFACAYLTYASSKSWRNGNFSANELPKDLKQELKNLTLRYADSSLHISGVIRLYDLENDGQFKEESPFTFIRNGKSYFSQLDYLCQFANESMIIQLDSINKSIVVSKNEGLDISLSGDLFPFDQYFTDSAEFRVTGTVAEKGKQRILELRSDFTPAIKVTRIVYDPVTYTIKETEIEWWKEQLFREEKDGKKCWLTKIDYSYGKPGSTSIDSLINSVIETQPKIKLKGSYSDYSLDVRAK